jgi:hypothetical protein
MSTYDPRQEDIQNGHRSGKITILILENKMNVTVDGHVEQKKEKLDLRVEHKFFTVIRWFGLVCATLSIFAALAMISSAGYKFTRTSHETILPETPRYSTYKDTIERQKQEKIQQGKQNSAISQKQQQAESAQAELDFEKKLQPFIDRIYTNFTKISDQEGGIDADSLRNYIKKNMDRVREGFPEHDDFQWKFIDGLAKLSDDVIADKNLPVNEKGKVDYMGTVFAWYTSSYFGNINDEISRMQHEVKKVEAIKADAGNDMTIAAFAFAAFSALTLLLVLLRIEHNTRQAGC